MIDAATHMTLRAQREVADATEAVKRAAGALQRYGREVLEQLDMTSSDGPWTTSGSNAASAAAELGVQIQRLRSARELVGTLDYIEKMRVDS